MKQAVRRLTLVIGLAAITWPAMAEPAGLVEGWERLARHEGTEAMAMFAALPDGAEQRLGLAAAWLAKRPRTDENADQAERLLREILKGEASAWVRGMAWYLLGRIEQVLREDRAAAAQCYRQLLAEQRGSLLADFAVVKLAVLELGDCLEQGGDLATVAAGLPRPEGRELLTQFHHVVAGHHIEAGERAAALAQLERVRELDTLRGRNRADVLVQIGRLAEAEGRSGLAREVYAEFLADNALDPRAQMVSDLLDGLGDEP